MKLFAVLIVDKETGKECGVATSGRSITPAVYFTKQSAQTIATRRSKSAYSSKYLYKVITLERVSDDNE
jgi:hypothetical protein